MPFLRVLALSDMQTPLSKIWTCVTDSIFYADNRYAKCARKVDD